MASYPGEEWAGFVAAFRDEIRSDYPDADPDRMDEIAEREARLDWLRQRWGEHHPCPNCGNREWWVSDPAPLGPQISAFPITCRYCGNTFLVDPKLTDLDAPVTERPDD